jgi:S-adenosylmethionine synthetase
VLFRSGVRGDLGKDFGADSNKRSVEIVGDRNKMNYKMVQRFIKLNDLIPELMKYVDHNIDKKQIGFIPAVELAFISPKNQQYIALAIDGSQSVPSQSQAKRMRELDQSNQLNPDMIDGIMLEEKKSKEVDQVIISTQELSKYFTKDKTPGEMKNQIIKLLDDWAGKEKTINPPEKKNEQVK